MCLSLTESVLLEIGIAQEIMKAETIKLNVQQGHNLQDVIKKTETEFDKSTNIMLVEGFDPRSPKHREAAQS